MSSSGSKIFNYVLIALIIVILNVGSVHALCEYSSNRLVRSSSICLSNYTSTAIFALIPNLIQQDATKEEFDDETEILFETDTSDSRQPLLYGKPDTRRTPHGGRKLGNLDAKNPDGYFDFHNIDSSGKSFLTSEYQGSSQIGYDYNIGLNEYLRLRKQNLQSRVWDSLLTNYDLKRALSGGDLARMLSESTGLTIPLPPNPLMGIFGKPEISINVNGEVNLRIGWRWDSQNLGTVSAFGQTQSSPIFSQDIRVNVSGRIGDKLRLSTDWNTRRTFDQDNRFKIGYEGYDDDIIKKVEVGNVSLPLTSTLIGGGQALFGLRTDFQFGPLYLKTLFSQRRGQRRFVDVRGGVSKQYFSIRAYDYAKNHFFIDTVYKHIYKEYFKYSTPVIPSAFTDPEIKKFIPPLDRPSFYRVKEIEVWETTNNVSDIIAGNSVAFADLEPKRLRQGESYDPSMQQVKIQTGVVERGRFIRLDTMKYKFDYNLGTLTIQNMKLDRTYAVSYRTEGPTTAPEDDLYHGTLTTATGLSDTLILKLIYRPNLQPGFKTIWGRQMRNIYSINATNVNVNETKIGIWYIRQSNDSVDVLEGAPDKLVTIMGVDQVNNASGQPQPDGDFDLIRPFFDARFGEITFPSIEPFRDGLRTYFAKLGNPGIAEQYVYNEVYDTTYIEARNNTEKDRFIISGEVSGRATNRIALGAFNLTPGSVRVTLDGVQLREYEDYVVDYYAGTLTIRNQRATLPNANLKVEYEQRDIFNISTRTLAGIRGDYELLNKRRVNAGLGFTLMLYDQSAVIDRVRIGEEPVSNTMVGFDGKFDWDTPWLTKTLDALPFYDTKAPSSMSVRGEWAMILPEPNKRFSDVASDNGEPVVYIDDFEGAQRYIPLGLNWGQWSHSSQPVDSSIAETDTLRALYRGKYFWYQYFIPRVNIRDVYPAQETITGRRRLNPLELDFNPFVRGIYNMNPRIPDSTNPGFNADSSRLFFDQNKHRMWAGMQRLFSSFNTNFDTENIEYIEIMMRIKQWDPGNTKMYVELGQISEDIIPNSELNTEDGIGDNPMPNDIIDPGEDVGIDAMNNDQEKLAYPPPLDNESDPAKDDYAFDFGKDDNERTELDFVRYNNFQGNALVSEIGQFPDTEILNRNNGQELSTANDYFQYEVNLLPDAINNPQIIGGNAPAGWFLYRIPIRKPSKSVGLPLFSNIQYIRVWVKGGVFKAQVADWRLVGSQWQRSSFLQNTPPNDSVLQLAFVNVFENSGEPDFYTMPPGVRAPRQLNNPDPQNDIKLNEQSLSVCVRNLRYGDERMAVRIYRPLDIFFYKEMKFFIHGDGSMPDQIVRGAIPKAWAFLRFGTDSNNYYEYRRPLVRGWQDIKINLYELTGTKQGRDSAEIYRKTIGNPNNDPLATFTVKGNPILTRIQFFGIGIANPAERFPNELSTCMWFDELRLISPERSSDWAGVVNADMKLADLGSVNASFSNSQPNFHNIEERFGNRITNTNWSVSMQGNLEKFAPKAFKQMKIPITYTHTEYMEDPEFVANNDINLAEAASTAYDVTRAEAINQGMSDEEAGRLGSQAANATKVRSQTLRVLDSWALTSIKLGIPISHWLINETFNKVTFGYSYSQEYERSPIYAERFNWDWRFNAQYAASIPELLSVKPLSWAEDIPILDTYKGLKLNLLPSSISAGINMSRRRQTEQSRFLAFPSPVLRDFSTMRTAQFSWKLADGGLINPIIDYSVTTNSTLVKYELDNMGRQRTGSELASSILFNDGALIQFGDNNLHTQILTINFKPRLPNIGGLTNYTDMSGSFITTYNWSDPLQTNPEIRDIAKNTSFQNQIRFNIGLRLKALGDSWFGRTKKGPKSRAKKKTPKDTTKTDGPKVSSSGIFTTIGQVFKTILLDYDKMDFIFNQTNSSTNPGVFGGTGMNNFWGRGMTMRGSDNIYGPSFAYQLGLTSNPHGNFGFTPSNKFPFFSFETEPGLRPPNGVMQDNFNQKTSFEIRTTRPLWEKATLDLNWKTDLGYNRNQTVITDASGVPAFTNIIALESFNRTFISFPTILGLNVFNNSIEHVVELFEARQNEILTNPNLDTVQKNQRLQNALAESFYDGLEAFSFLSGSAGKFLPSINWGIRWEGLEEWAIFGGIAKKISIEHKYNSTYTENVQVTDNGRAVQNQNVQWGFQPMIGVTTSFDEDLLDGNLTATVRWSSTKSYQLNSAAKSTISSQATTELTGQASYTMKGFDFILLGLKLENDLEFSFLATYKDNSRKSFNIFDEESYANNSAGRTLDGNTQIIIEPRARYSMSNRVTASFFVRYEGTFTEGAAQPGFHTTQVGFDIRISVAGGR